MTVKEANLKIGDRFRFPQYPITVWEVESIVDRGAIAKAIDSHKTLVEWRESIEKI